MFSFGCNFYASKVLILFHTTYIIICYLENFNRCFLSVAHCFVCVKLCLANVKRRYTVVVAVVFLRYRIAALSVSKCFGFLVPLFSTA